MMAVATPRGSGSATLDHVGGVSDEDEYIGGMRARGCSF
jgi:hypothetical protein